MAQQQSSSGFNLFRPTTWKTGKLLSNARKASLGGENHFVFNSKLNRWVEKGKDTDAHQFAPPAAPPTQLIGKFPAPASRRGVHQRYVMQSNLPVSGSNLPIVSTLLPPPAPLSQQGVEARLAVLPIAFLSTSSQAEAAPVSQKVPLLPPPPSSSRGLPFHLIHPSAKADGSSIQGQLQPERSCDSFGPFKAPSNEAQRQGLLPPVQLLSGDACSLAAQRPSPPRQKQASAMDMPSLHDASGHPDADAKHADQTTPKKRSLSSPSTSTLAQLAISQPQAMGQALAVSFANAAARLTGQATDPFDQFFDQVMHPGIPGKMDGPLPWELPDAERNSDSFMKQCSNQTWVRKTSRRMSYMQPRMLQVVAEGEEQSMLSSHAAMEVPNPDNALLQRMPAAEQQLTVVDMVSSSLQVGDETLAPQPAVASDQRASPSPEASQVTLSDSLAPEASIISMLSSVAQDVGMDGGSGGGGGDIPSEDSMQHGVGSTLSPESSYQVLNAEASMRSIASLSVEPSGNFVSCGLHAAAALSAEPSIEALHQQEDDGAQHAHQLQSEIAAMGMQQHELVDVMQQAMKAEAGEEEEVEVETMVVCTAGLLAHVDQLQDAKAAFMASSEDDLATDALCVTQLLALQHAVGQALNIAKATVPEPEPALLQEEAQCPSSSVAAAVEKEPLAASLIQQQQQQQGEFALTGLAPLAAADEGNDGEDLGALFALPPPPSLHMPEPLPAPGSAGKGLLSRSSVAALHAAAAQKKGVPSRSMTSDHINDAMRVYERRVAGAQKELSSTRAQLDMALTRLTSMQEDFDELLLCLGMESAKNKVLCDALRAAGIDPGPLVAAAEAGWMSHSQS